MCSCCSCRMRINYLSVCVCACVCVCVCERERERERENCMFDEERKKDLSDKLHASVVIQKAEITIYKNVNIVTKFGEILKGETTRILE